MANHASRNEWAQLSGHSLMEPDSLRTFQMQTDDQPARAGQETVSQPRGDDGTMSRAMAKDGATALPQDSDPAADSGTSKGAADEQATKAERSI